MRKTGITKIDGKKLRALRDSFALTQTQFAAKLGMSEVRVRGIEGQEEAGVFTKVFVAIAALTGKSVDEVRELLAVKGDAPAKPKPDKTFDIDAKKIKPVPPIPTFHLAVAAGPWTEVSEVAELYNDDPRIDDGRFRIFIGGDSMEKVYPNGALVEFQSVRWGEGIIEPGQDYYVQRGEYATFKRLFKIDGERLIFKAINKHKYPEAIETIHGDIVRLARAEWILSRPAVK